MAILGKRSVYDPIAENKLLGASSIITGHDIRISATDGLYIVVGGYATNWDYTMGANPGGAFVFDVATCTLSQTLTNPNPPSSGNSGFASGAVDISGNYAIIGAPGNYSGASGIIAGEAYIYDVTTGNIVHTLNLPAPVSSDKFGARVAITGNYAAVTITPYSGTGTTNPNTVNVYNVTTGVLVRTFTKPYEYWSTWDAFGETISIVGDRILIANSQAQYFTGECHLYDIPSGTLLNTFLRPMPASGWGNYGTAAVYGSNFIVIADYANSTDTIYIYDSTTFLFKYSMVPSYGFDDITLSGNLMAILSPDTGLAEEGQVFIYDISGSSAILVYTLTNPSQPPIYMTALSIDGNNVVFGNIGDDSTFYRYTLV